MSRLDDLDALITSLSGATLEEMELALRGYLDREVRTVLADRAAAGGETFNGGTITEQLIVDAPGTAPGVRVDLSGGAPAVGFKVNGQAGLDDDYFLASDGNSTIVVIHKGGVELYGNRADRDTLYLEPLVALDAGMSIANFQPESGSNSVRITRGAYLKFRATAAPADAELEAHECAFWFDSTNGAAKLMVKAKQADGTVRTGEVTLT